MISGGVLVFIKSLSALPEVVANFLILVGANLETGIPNNFRPYIIPPFKADKSTTLPLAPNAEYSIAALVILFFLTYANNSFIIINPLSSKTNFLSGIINLDFI